MIKSELIAELSAKLTNLPEKQVADAINDILDSMSASLADNKRIEVRGFGSFTLHHRPSRNAHNPKSGEKVITKAKHSPHFKPGKDLRERVDASRMHYQIKED